MARATKERLERDAARFGLGHGISSSALGPAYNPDARCPVCKRPLREHVTARQVHDCAIEARTP